MQYRPPGIEARDMARDLRAAATPAEARLWRFLRNGGLGVRFRRQEPVGPWVVDLLASRPKVAVELDGAHHLREPDARKLRPPL